MKLNAMKLETYQKLRFRIEVHYFMKKHKLLPLGSIVILKDGDKKLMIYGRVQIAAEINKSFDYIACLWPEGNLDIEHIYLFNHLDIDTVTHRGYSDYEDIAFLEVIDEQLKAKQDEET